MLTPSSSITVTPLAKLTVDIESSEDLSFKDVDEKKPSENKQPSEEMLAAARKREQFCKGRSWWECTQATTQGACVLDEGKCVAIPMTKKPERYYEQWLRIHKPIYAHVQVPAINNDGEIINVPRRKRSIRRLPISV